MVMDNHLSIDLDWIKTVQQLDFINELIFESLQVDQVNFCVQHQALFHFFKYLNQICVAFFILLLVHKGAFFQ